MKTAPSLIKAACLGIALMGSTAIVATIVAPDVAYAKSDKAKKAKKAKSNNGKSRGAAASSAESSGKVYKGQGNAVAIALGVHPSELGKLNAWNSNSDNMNPNSTVGQLNLFKQAVLDGSANEQALSDAQDLLAGMPVPAKSYDEMVAEIAAAEAAEADALNVLNACDPVTDDDACAGEGAAYNLALDATIAAQAEFDADPYYTQYEVVADYQATVDTQLGDQRMMLEDMANKPITDTIFDGLRALAMGG